MPPPGRVIGDPENCDAKDMPNVPDVLVAEIFRAEQPKIRCCQCRRDHDRLHCLCHYLASSSDRGTSQEI